MNQKYLPAGRSPARLATHTPDGVEIRQPGLPLRADEVEDLEISFDFGFRAFDLGVPADAAAYRDVMDQLTNRVLVPVGRQPDPVWSERTGSYHVILRWARPYAEVPRRILDRLGG